MGPMGKSTQNNTKRERRAENAERSGAGGSDESQKKPRVARRRPFLDYVLELIRK